MTQRAATICFTSSNFAPPLSLLVCGAISSAIAARIAMPAASGSGEALPLCRCTNQTRISAPAAVKPISTSQFQALPKVMA